MVSLPRQNRWKFGQWKCECGRTGKIDRDGFRKHRNGQKCREYFARLNQPKPPIQEEYEDEIMEDVIIERDESSTDSDWDTESTTSFMSADNSVVNVEEVAQTARTTCSFGEPDVNVIGDEEEDVEIVPMEIDQLDCENTPASSQDGIFEIPEIPQLQLYSIHKQKHPYADASSETISVSPPPIYANNIYWPFKTEEDFLQTEVLLNCKASNKFIDRQLALSQRLQGRNGRLTLKSSVQLRQVLEHGTIFEDGRFQKKEIKTSFNGKTYKHTLYHRDILRCIREQVEDPELFSQMRFDAERHWISQPDGKGNMRQYQEYYQSDDMWEIQSAMGRRTKPLIIFIYADETQLTAFGNNHLWPIYFWIGNLPQAVRASHGKGGATLIGYLPKVHMAELSDTLLARLRAAVYHDCLEFLFQPMETTSTEGDWFDTGNGGRRHYTTIIPLTPTDYPEGCRQQNNIGYLGPCPCLMCLVLRTLLSDNSQRWPKRTYKDTMAEIEKGDANARKIGVRVAKNAFDIHSNTFFDSCRIIGADKLHWFEQGVFGRRLFPCILEDCSTAEKKAIDKSFKEMRRYPGMIHFANGIVKLKWRSGKDHSLIARLLAPELHGIFPPNRNWRSELLQLLRLYGMCSVLIDQTTHTEETLEIFEEVLKRMGQLEEELADDLKINLNVPKRHFMHHHLIDSIREKGPVCNTDTGAGEARHHDTKVRYANTNRQSGSFQLQIMERTRWSEIIASICARVEASQALSPIIQNEGPRIKLGSPDSKLTRLSEVNLAFGQGLPKVDLAKLRKQIRTKLYHVVPEYRSGNIRVPRDQHLPDISGLKVKVYKTAYIKYISLLDASNQADQIRSNRNWCSTGPRYDFVLLNWGNNTKRCAQVMGLFSANIGDTTYNFALIRLLGPLTRHATTGYLHASGTDDYRIEFTDTFIRSVHVHVPHPPHNVKYIINDLIDADMYYRLGDIKCLT